MNIQEKKDIEMKMICIIRYLKSIIMDMKILFHIIGCLSGPRGLEKTLLEDLLLIKFDFVFLNIINKLWSILEI